jgi:long-chain acyl-CoA synthetase
MTIFVTGATGFLGRHLARRLVDDGEDVLLLVRDRSHESARERALRALASVGDGAPDPARVAVCLGSLEAPALGLSAADRDRTIARCDQFLHCGANVQFDLDLAQARAVNVGGTRGLLDLARARQRAGGVARVDHVSTAYVAGNRTDVVLETELDGRAGHKNNYESTKFEAEVLVREAQAELPVAIHRPSIVVGEAASGRTQSFKVLYWPAKVYAMGLWRTVPGDPASPLDLVPVDFVRDAILALRRQPGTVGRCFHVAAGIDGCITMADMRDILARHFPRRRPLRFVPPEAWMRYVHPVLKLATFGVTRRVVSNGEHYVPYFTKNPRFDNREAAAHLAAAGVALPRVADYVDRLFRYCVETDWGKREPATPGGG